MTRNLLLYRALAAVGVTPFMLPIIVLFWQDNGLDMQQVFLLQSLYAVGVVILEVPAGLVADRLGRKASVVAAMAVTSISFAVYGVGTGFWSFLAAELGLALGASLLSGADSALLFESLRALGRSGEYGEQEGKAHGARMLTIALCALAGGVIGAWDLRAAMSATAVGPLVGLVIALAMTEVNPPEPAGARRLLEDQRRLLSEAWRFVSKHQLVRWYLAFSGVLTGTATWLLWLVQPSMEATGLPAWAFGAAFASFNLVAAAGGRFAHSIEARLGSSGTLVLMGALQVAAPLLMALVFHPACFIFVWGHQLVRGWMRPGIQSRILPYTHADKRATVLSLVSLLGRLFFAVTGPFVGWAAEVLPLRQALGMQAVAAAVALSVLAWRYRQIPAKYFIVKEKVAARV